MFATHGFDRNMGPAAGTGAGVEVTTLGFRAQEIYGGVSLPLGAHHEVTVIVDVTRLPRIEKVSTLLVWKIAF